MKVRSYRFECRSSETNHYFGKSDIISTTKQSKNRTHKRSPVTGEKSNIREEKEMAEFSVKAAELRTKALTLEGYLNQLQTERTNLQDAEATLMKGFEGDAATSFDTEYKNFDQKMEAFKTTTAQYVVKLREQAAAYEKADQNAALRARGK